MSQQGQADRVHYRYIIITKKVKNAGNVLQYIPCMNPSRSECTDKCIMPVSTLGVMIVI